MKLNTLPQTFKGYDAAPLRHLYYSKRTAPYIKDDLSKIAQQEHLGAIEIPSYDMWLQDCEVILDQEPRNLLLHGSRADILNVLAMEKMDMVSRKSNYYLTGGDCFLGKYPNGKKWLIAGDLELYNKKEEERKLIARNYGVEAENIFQIPSQNFHLDMFLRPIGYPYVLLDSPELVLEELEKLDDNSKDYTAFRNQFFEYEFARQKCYKSSLRVYDRLKSLGFEPIVVPAVWGKSVNFINAIVNAHSDGSLSYITNSSKCENPFSSIAQEIFEQQIQQKVPNLDKIYFVQGASKFSNPNRNCLMAILNKFHGGIHCMTLEDPEFSRWI